MFAALSPSITAGGAAKTAAGKKLDGWTGCRSHLSAPEGAGERTSLASAIMLRLCGGDELIVRLFCGEDE
jgi:hypothetical protein